MLIVCGLGNPGKEYEHTRHNVGFDVVACTAAFLHVTMRKRCCRLYRRGDGVSEAGPFILMQPLTYMNASGKVLSYVGRELSLPGSRLVVVCDQMDLPCGSVRLKKGGRDAGHRGLKSLIECYGSEDFIRLYIGIGRPSEGVPVIDHVLGVPQDGEAAAYKAGVEAGAQALLKLLRGNTLEEVMNEFNGKQTH